MTSRQELWLAWSTLAALLLSTVIAALLTSLPSGEAAGGGLPAGIAPLVNALLLSLAASVSAWVLIRQIGEWSPLFIATVVFSSMLGVAVFSTGLDILFLTTTALGLAIVFRSHAPAETRVKEIYEVDLVEPPSRRILRSTVAGGLLAVSIGANLLNSLVLLAAIAGAPQGSAKRERLGMLTGGLVGGLVGVLVSRLFETHNPQLHLATEQVYFPGITGILSSPPVLLRSFLELFLGRHIGLFVAFFPLLFCLFSYERSSTRLRSTLLLAALAVLILPVFYRPFDFWLGEQAASSAGRELVSHTLIPIYPVFWFIGSRVVRPWQAVLVALLSLFLIGQAWAGAWLRPAAPSLARYASAVAATPYASVANQILPLETSQRALLLSGVADRDHGKLWLRRLDHVGEIGEASEGAELELRTDVSATFLLAAKQPTDTLVLRVSGDPAPSSIGLDGGEVKQIMFEPRGGVRFEVDLEAAVAHHPSWWSKEPLHFYELRLLLPSGGLEEVGVFRVTMEPGGLLQN